MKKYYKNEKYKRYNKRHSRKLFSREQQYKLWRRSKRRQQQGLTEEDIDRKKEGYTYLDIPSNFTFLTNTDEVLKIVSKIEKLLHNNIKTFINLKEVVEIDNGAITALLSIMTEFKLKNVSFNGNFPRNKAAKEILLSSGFFEHLFRSNEVKEELFSKSSQFAYGKENQIFTKPGKNVVSAVAKEICENVSNTLGYSDVTPKGVYRTLIELMHNTHNHANLEEEGKELWWLTVHHDKINKNVKFVFLDFGVGIFTSLREKKEESKFYKMYDKLKERTRYGSDAEILRLILKGELHKTSTELDYRGKGLHSIYEVWERQQIKNLHIITNNVFANIENNEYKTINTEFNGTLVYWEIDSESEVNEWKI